MCDPSNGCHILYMNKYSISICTAWYAHMGHGIHWSSKPSLVLRTDTNWTSGAWYFSLVFHHCIHYWSINVLVVCLFTLYTKKIPMDVAFSFTVVTIAIINYYMKKTSFHFLPWYFSLTDWPQLVLVEIKDAQYGTMLLPHGRNREIPFER